MFKRKSVLAACGAAVLVLVVEASAQGWVTESRTTYLTFSGPVALPGVTLGAGTYIFERAAPGVPHVVRVLRRDRSKVYFMAFTHLIERPARMRDGRSVTFEEAPAGTPPPIKAWYPLGETTGHEFIYRR